MRRGYTRTFLHLFSDVLTHPANLESTIDPFRMEEIIADVLKEHRKVPLLFASAGPNRRAVRLMDADVAEDNAVLLIACADQSIPDPTMINFDTAQARSVGAQDGYTWSYSAHLFLGFRRTSSGDYPAILEVMPKVSRRVVEDFMNRSFRRDKYQNDDGKAVWPSLNLRGDASNRLVEALRSGKLVGVDLLTERPREDLGPGETGMKPAREALSFRPPRDRELRRAFAEHDKPSLLRKYLRWGRKNGYQTMRVVLNRTSDIPDHLDISTDDPDLDADEMFFVRRTTKEFHTKLDAAHPELVPEVVEVGLELLESQYSHRRRKP